MNIVAKVSGDILFEASLSATVLNNRSNLCRKFLCDGVNSNKSSCRAVRSLVVDDSAFGGY